MSGRWVESSQNMALSSLIVLDNALSKLSGFDWHSRPRELNELEIVNLELDKSQDALKSLIKEAEELGVEASSMEAALEGDEGDLTASISAASKSSEEMQSFSEKIVSEISNLDSLVSRRSELISSLENNLPNVLTLETTSGRKQLARKLGTYRATERQWQEYGVSSGRVDWEWLNSLTMEYKKSKEEITVEEKPVDKSEYSNVLRKLSEKRKQADLASIKASEEKMRRERKAEINKIFKERGYKVRRKSVGKKNEWSFTSFKK